MMIVELQLIKMDILIVVVFIGKLERQDPIYVRRLKMDVNELADFDRKMGVDYEELGKNLTPELNKIYEGDCLELMKMLPDKYFDLLITDPPYGITGEEWDNIPKEEYFKQMFRVSKNQIIFGADYFCLPKKGGWIVWNKRPFLKRVNPLEFIWTSFGLYDEILDYTYAGNCEGWHGKKLKPNYNKTKAKHRAQKPLAVCEWLLNKFAKKEDKIFDPFAGSGSFLVACKELGLNFVGCEINPEYVKIAKDRLSQCVFSVKGEEK
jgi:site-specific DNA-methyltransferase (adenine-specific)